MMAEYIPIARARLAWWMQFDSYEAAQANYQSVARGNTLDDTAQAAGQLRLFEIE